MPRYKKKKHNRILNAPKKSTKVPLKKSNVSDDIEMVSYKKKKAKVDSTPMRVVAGKKGERIKKFKLLSSLLAFVIVVILILQVFLPAGLLQTISNLTSVLGTGSYPISVSGSDTLSVVPLNNYFFLLTDTYISAYSSAGKILFSEAHGFEKPILATSKGCVMLYNQGSTEFVIYNLRGIKTSANTDNDIICGAISDSGKIALVTNSESYASSVIIYNKSLKTVFEWYSAKETINNIAFSSNGKKIAVSTFNSDSGIFNSKVNIINFKSATPEHTINYDGELVYGLKTGNKSSFTVIKSNGIDTVKWNGYKTESYKDDYNILYYRDTGSVNAAVFYRDSDKTDNKIIILSNGGKVKNSVKFKGIINDIQVKGSNIYCINDNSVSVLDMKGNIKFTKDFGFGGKGISVISANVAAVITNNEIIRIKIKEEN